MHYVFIGDIHGQYEIVEQALEKEGIKIFVGDFLDSFNRSVDDQFRCLDLVLNAKAKYPDEVYSLLGNHELSYLMHQPCSGHNSATQIRVDMDYKQDLEYAFDDYLIITRELEDKSWDNLLVTHAGLSSVLLDFVFGKDVWFESTWAKDMEYVMLELDDWVADPNSPAYQVGQARGGYYPCGGIYWCDFRYEFKPIKGLKQVFGHTRGAGIRTKGDNYCIDCLEDGDVQFLELDIPDSIII